MIDDAMPDLRPTFLVAIVYAWHAIAMHIQFFAICPDFSWSGNLIPKYFFTDYSLQLYTDKTKKCTDTVNICMKGRNLATDGQQIFRCNK